MIMNLFSGKEKIFETISGEEMAEVVREMGFSPHLTTDSGGDPMIKFNIEGLLCQVLFYGCASGRAKSIQFSAGFAMKRPPEKINEWNRTKRFGKAYLDSDGEVMIQFDVDLEGGVQRTYLEEILKRWRSVFMGFIAFLRD